MAGYEKDIFISYAHIDNQPLTPGDSGWITRFHATLQAILDMRLGHTARIWRDDKLQGNDIFGDEILAQFGETAVLLSVLSPRYLNSEWCTREISEFCHSAEQDGGVRVDNKARIFKVLKTPVDSEETLPAIAKEVLGYEFFTYENEAPLELDAAYGEKYGQAYKRKVAQLASDLSQLLKKLATEKESEAEQGSDEKISIYLAECSYDQRETRDILAGELSQHEYHILPDRPMPQEESDYIEAVRSMLESCVFSIHLVGDTYGAVPYGPTQKSVTEIQNELAVSKSIEASPEFKRIIWLPEGSASEQPQQQAFIDSLHRDAMTQFGADLITADLQALKMAIHTALEDKNKPAEPIFESGSIANDGSKLIYLIFDQKDRKATVELRKYLRAQGLEVATPAFEGDAAAVRQNHLNLIKQCDAVLLFYGAGDEAWKRTFDMELKKIPGYRGERPLLANYTYLAAPKTADKEDLIDMEEPFLIEGFQEFTASSMQAFIRSLDVQAEVV